MSENKSWITRRFIITAIVSSLIFGPIWSVLVYSAGDQYIRNLINDWMSEPDVYKLLALEPGEFGKLPVHWRQALAEIVTRTESSSAELRNLVKGLSTEDINLIDRLAPYVTQDFIIRDSSEPTRHPMPTLSLSHFSRLQEIGIVQDIQRGFKLTVKINSNEAKNLAGASAAVLVTASEENIEFTLPITKLTNGGARLIHLLRVPSNLSYLEWVAKSIEQPELQVDVIALDADPDFTESTILNRMSWGIIQRDSLWPLQERE